MKYWVGKTRKILVNGVELKVRMGKEHYEMIFDKKYMKPYEEDQEYIPVDMATDFIWQNVVGDITKEELDD